MNYLTEKWTRLCVRCANNRLRNPYSGWLPMRRAGVSL